MDTKIQKLIFYNERLKLHYKNEVELNTSDLMDYLLHIGVILQQLVESSLKLGTDLKQSKLQVVSTLEVKNKLLDALFKKSELEETNLSSLYNLSVSYKNVSNECRQLRKEVAQLKAEIELIKQNEQNRF